ncbi:tetratricopeptide repeat protein [Streptomyces violascens]|uniref:tetratricopeptide repeat protein n=1 Tax=Streptomyces violascens TaxID=67381 RepID=UPI003688C817
MSEEWRRFPEGVPASRLLDFGSAAERRGDLVAAGNWYFHAKRRGAFDARGKLSSLSQMIEGLADAGDADAKALLAGIALDDGSNSKALRLFREAAELGAVEAKRGLGYMLTNGIGVQRDSVAASRLLLEAAKSGDGYAAYNLAVNYYNGDGVTRNAREFLRWLRFAAELGIPEACAFLGDKLSAQGNLDEALIFYVRAAKSGHVPAMLLVGRRYRDGIGAPSNLVQAVRWFLAMLDRGNGDGVHEALELVPEMTVEQIREAGRLSNREADAEVLIRRKG